jgi:hypothetical protein
MYYYFLFIIIIAAGDQAGEAAFTALPACKHEASKAFLVNATPLHYRPGVRPAPDHGDYCCSYSNEQNWSELLSPPR